MSNTITPLAWTEGDRITYRGATFVIFGECGEVFECEACEAEDAARYVSRTHATAADMRLVLLGLDDSQPRRLHHVAITSVS